MSRPHLLPKQPMKMTQRQVPSPGNANQYEGGRQIGFLRQAGQNLQKAYSKAKEEEKA
jgi:hypothetical protein